MKRCLLPGILALLLVTNPSQAQKIIEKKASLTNNQRLVLDLPYADAIRITGVSSKGVAVKASVTINNNKLNDALLLTLNSTGDEVRVQSALDNALLSNSQATDCPDEQGSTMLINDADKNGSGAYRICIHVDYEIEVPAGASVTVETLGGNIEVTGLNGPLEAKSLGGFVDVSWPPARGAEVSLSSANGEVYTNQDIAFDKPQNGSSMGQRVRGKLGHSGPAIKLESFGGDVFFRKQN